ncbi:MAG: hypothetical protein PHN60_03150 [Candidatus Gracilibacteria bacterium]|nr:hypothetical protein [Candidatus Gracilibacteria bacterium]
MENTMIFALISTIIYLIGAIPYTIGIIRGEVLPHPFSYGTWIVLVGINNIVLFQENAGWTLLPAIVQFVFMVVNVIGGCFAFRKIQINWFDYFCLGLAILSLFIWWKVGVEYAVIMTVIVDAIAFLPTIKKGWIQPHSEYIWPWINSALFPIFLILSLKSPIFITVFFWAYLFISSGSLSIMLWYRQRLIPKELS